ncbi:hypothetical protein NX059_011575 [Plenodomus lindquistii]|nr:hypothetical protein NX059_011575 [Plenodomus lindquistii]
MNAYSGGVGITGIELLDRQGAQAWIEDGAYPIIDSDPLGKIVTVLTKEVKRLPRPVDVQGKPQYYPEYYLDSIAYVKTAIEKGKKLADFVSISSKELQKNMYMTDRENNVIGGRGINGTTYRAILFVRCGGTFAPPDTAGVKRNTTTTTKQECETTWIRDQNVFDEGKDFEISEDDTLTRHIDEAKICNRMRDAYETGKVIDVSSGNEDDDSPDKSPRPAQPSKKSQPKKSPPRTPPRDGGDSNDDSDSDNDKDKLNAAYIGKETLRGVKRKSPDDNPTKDGADTQRPKKKLKMTLPKTVLGVSEAQLLPWLKELSPLLQSQMIDANDDMPNVPRARE